MQIISFIILSLIPVALMENTETADDADRIKRSGFGPIGGVLQVRSFSSYCEAFVSSDYFFPLELTKKCFQCISRFVIGKCKFSCWSLKFFIWWFIFIWPWNERSFTLIWRWFWRPSSGMVYSCHASNFFSGMHPF